MSMSKSLPTVAMYSIRGKLGRWINFENFDNLQFHAYTMMIPKRMERDGLYFDLKAYLSDGSIIQCEAVFHRGSTALAMPYVFASKIYGR